MQIKDDPELYLLKEYCHLTRKRYLVFYNYD